MQSGLSAQEALYGTIGLMLLQLIFTGIGALLIDRNGRRKLLLGGNLACILAAALLVLTNALANHDLCANCRYGSLACLMFFIMVFNIGPGSVPLILPSEIFPKAAKTSAVNVALACMYGSSAIVSIAFPLMQAKMKEWTFTVFLGILFVCTVYLWLTLMETKGKTFEEIQMQILVKNGERAQNGEQCTNATSRLESH